MSRTARQVTLSAAAVAVAAGVALHRSQALPSPGADAVAPQPPAVQSPGGQASSASREDAYRANNIGVAHLEQYDFAAAATAFRQALQLDRGLAIARLNLGIALLYGGDADAARREIEAARPALPDRPQADYVLGLIARTQNRTDDAIDSFARVQQMDPSDPGAAVNLGQLYLEQRKYPQALEAFRTAIAAEPYNATAAYGLATALIRTGDAAHGRTAMEDFQRLRTTKYATTYSQTYLEQGRYAEAIASTGAEPDLVDDRVPAVTFADATTALIGAAANTGTNATATGADVAASVALIDIDGDGDLDLVDSGRSGLHVYFNDRGRFTDRTDVLFGAGAAPAAGVVAGDYDNDGRTDLLVLRSAGVTLDKQDASGRFTDVTAAAGLPAMRGARAAAWLDADHDGDLDLIVALDGGGGSAVRLFRNNGDGRFTDITTDAGVATATPVLAAIPTDYDNRRDIDVMLAGSTGAPILFRNLRDGTFRNVAGDVGLSIAGGTTAAAIGDVNKDGYPDFFFGRRDTAGTFALSDGRARFTTAAAPDLTAGALAAQFLDYDNDGLLDLVVVTARGPQLLRNLGNRWMDQARAFAAAAAPVAQSAWLASGDLDGDGDADVIVRTRDRLTIWRNDGGNRGRALRVTLSARVSNRSAVGTKIDARAGSLRQHAETYATTPAVAPADVVFGFGTRAGGDVVRVLWPSGILQAETAAGEPPKPLAGTMAIQELDRKPSSCPFLFTWNGSRFEFITDFLGGGEMGYLESPGERNHPDPDEYVRIDGDRLRPRDGRYELRITNELEEALFLDRAQLVAVAHPRDVEVYPNEGLRANQVSNLESQVSGVEARGAAGEDTGPTPTFFIVRGARPPLAASDDHGHDVLDRISGLDRRYPDDFTLESTRGYAAAHELTLTLPRSGVDGARRVLLLTGWTDYAFSSDNVAASQRGLRLLPPELQVERADGSWRTAIDDIGFPAGRPQTVVVDLGRRIPASATRVRIATTMRVYWDRILIGWADCPPLTVTRLDPLTARLRRRGFSAEQSSDGREPYGYDYQNVSRLSPWKLLPGRYTREGDVRELVMRIDDRFVIAGPGDEIALSFDAAHLPPLPEGWTRTFLLYANGFSKEMDLNSASPDELAPLPFHGMKRYPYDPRTAPPPTAAQRDDMQRYHTRIVKRMLPPLELAGK